MSRKLSVNTLYLLFRLGEKSRVTTRWRAGFLGALSELFDICGLPRLLLNHFSLAGLKRQRPTSVSKTEVRCCEWSRVWMQIWIFFFFFFLRGIWEKVCGLALSSLYLKEDWTVFFFFHFFPLALTVFFPPLLLPQVVYFTEMYKIFSELTDQIDQAGLTDEQRERETEAKLSELRALSIVADDWGRKSRKTRKGSFHGSLNGLHSFQAPSPSFKRTESD